MAAFTSDQSSQSRQSQKTDGEGSDTDLGVPQSYFLLETSNRTKVGQRQESLGAPLFAHVERSPSRRYDSDAKFTAVGGFSPELKVYPRFDSKPVLSRLLKNPTVTIEEDAITMSLLELSGIATAAYVTQVILHDRPDMQGDPVLLRGDSVAAVS